MQCIDRTGSSFVCLVRVRHVMVAGRYSATILAILPLPSSRHILITPEPPPSTIIPATPTVHPYSTQLSNPFDDNAIVGEQEEDEKQQAPMGPHPTRAPYNIPEGQQSPAKTREEEDLAVLHGCLHDIFPRDDDGVARTDMEYHMLHFPIPAWFFD